MCAEVRSQDSDGRNNQAISGGVDGCGCGGESEGVKDGKAKKWRENWRREYWRKIGAKKIGAQLENAAKFNNLG
nr:hypothetical protein Itr_chr11CG22290 [Ipomoea trifida]